MNKTLKNHLISSLITFIAVLAMAFLPHIESITMESFKDGTFIALLFTAFRTALKVVIEQGVAFYQEWKQGQA